MELGTGNRNKQNKQQAGWMCIKTQAPQANVGVICIYIAENILQKSMTCYVYVYCPVDKAVSFMHTHIIN